MVGYQNAKKLKPEMARFIPGKRGTSFSKNFLNNINNKEENRRAELVARNDAKIFKTSRKIVQKHALFLGYGNSDVPYRFIPNVDCGGNLRGCGSAYYISECHLQSKISSEIISKGAHPITHSATFLILRLLAAPPQSTLIYPTLAIA